MIAGGPRPCGYWTGTEDNVCGAPDARRYGSGYRCPLHTPAALLGLPEPGRTANQVMPTAPRRVHPYGPDQARLAPATMEVTLGSITPGSQHGPFRRFQAAIPKVLTDQRYALNTMAHEAGKDGTVLP